MTSSSWLARLKATVVCLAFGTAAGALVAVMFVCAVFALVRFRVDPRIAPPVTVLLLLATGVVVQLVSVRAAERRAPRVMTFLSLWATWAGLLAGEGMAWIRTEMPWEQFLRHDVVSIIGGAIGAAMGVWIGASIGWKRSAAAAIPYASLAPARPTVALVKAGAGGAAVQKPRSGPTRTKVSLHAVEHICPICADDANPIRQRGPDVCVCTTCGAWHHQDCWRNNGSACGVLGQH